MKPVCLCLGLPDLPYFTGDPVFQPPSPTSRKEATGEIKCPVFDKPNLEALQIETTLRFWHDKQKSFTQKTLWDCHQQQPGAMQNRKATALLTY